MYDVCGYILDIIYIYTHIRIQHYRLVAFSQRLAFIHKPGGFFFTTFWPLSKLLMFIWIVDFTMMDYHLINPMLVDSCRLGLIF